MADVVILDRFPVEDSKRLEVAEDLMILDTSPAEASVQPATNAKDHENVVQKPLKRKRTTIDGNVICENKESLARECRQELDYLFEYYKELAAHKLHLEESKYSLDYSVIACLLEESNLPFSKLVEEIHEKLKGREGVNLASVSHAVLQVGQRSRYGFANIDVDVLEDESSSCLWCWETREMKLLPVTERGFLSTRRIGRKKVHERISALSETLAALSKPESHDNYKSDLMKASQKLGKALNGPGIRSWVEKLKQKNDADMAEKEAKLKEKELIKELERNKRSAEKEKKRMDRELQKEKLQSEKELKRLQEEAEKEEKRREKEEAELKKHLKKQQEEAERDQRRREKEEAELKRQQAIRKQATVMERFLKSTKSNSNSDNSDTKSSTKVPTSDRSGKSEPSWKSEEVVNEITSSMDCALSRQDSTAAEDLRKLHVAGWHNLSCLNRFIHWGSRHKPKIEVIKELKLQGSSSDAESCGKATTPNKRLACNEVNDSSEPSLHKLVGGGEEIVADDPSHDGVDTAPVSVRLSNRTRKLLQFDKSNRPPYCGTWRKKSGVVGPRHPLKKDPDMDYDVDSDEEWEEEDPGESLSDCDKDEEEELEEGNTKNEDDDESEDSFFVPDGYLSENEGVQVDSTPDGMEDEARSSSCCRPEVESEEFRALLRQQKYLQNLTEQALRKNQPFIISNLMHEKAELMMAEDLTGTPKHEQMCLQALCMRAYPGGSIVEMRTNNNSSEDDQEVSHSQSKSSTTPTITAAVIQDSDLPEFVQSIRSYPHGINKVLESLQRKFPSYPKSQLRNKVREIADFVDNRWRVKKEVLNMLGLSNSPDKGGRPKGIATFFSKRCLPPEGKSMNIPESSPQPCGKTEALHDGDGHCTKALL